MENSRKKYRVATPEEKENIMEKLAPSAREKVKEIYRCLPTADMPTAGDMKKAKTPEEKREILRKIMLSLFRQEKEAHRLTGTKERHRLTCTLESSPFEKRWNKEMSYTSYHAGTMTAARLRCIGVRLKTDGYTGIKAIRLYPAEIMDTDARLRYIDARLKASGYTRA